MWCSTSLKTRLYQIFILCLNKLDMTPVMILKTQQHVITGRLSRIGLIDSLPLWQEMWYTAVVHCSSFLVFYTHSCQQLFATEEGRQIGQPKRNAMCQNRLLSQCRLSCQDAISKGREMCWGPPTSLMPVLAKVRTLRNLTACWQLQQQKLWHQKKYCSKREGVLN